MIAFPSKFLSDNRKSASGPADQTGWGFAELVRLKVDVIVTSGSTATRPAKEATSTISIVTTFDDDPVGNSFLASLARIVLSSP